jgi:uncharacterized protein (DUF1330 family)
MAKAYWIVCYRSIKNPEALQGYAKLAGPAIQAAGGRFLVRGTPAKTYEAGLKVLGNAAERDMRIVEGVG